LLEKELKESIDILGCSICVGGSSTTIRITNIQGLNEYIKNKTTSF
jgi:hypothetical protein